MIIFEGVTYGIGAGAKMRKILAGTEVTIPSDRRIAVLANDADERRVFMELLGGLLMPQSGRLIRKARVSFPAGYVGGFKADLSLRSNVAYVARLYSADVDSVVNFVAQIPGFKKAFDKPYRRLSPVERRKFSEVLAFTIPFDVYLFEDELVRDKGRLYNEHARALFDVRIKNAGMIIATKDEAFIEKFCDMGLVVCRGQVRLFEKVKRALAFSKKAKIRAEGKKAKTPQDQKKEMRRQERKALRADH
jgi:capsular polysaccharide transport system ATP-binding protein